MASITSLSSITFMSEMFGANSEQCECLRELCRVVAETCGQASFVPPLVELGYALTCAKCVAGGVAYEDLNISRRDCMLQPKCVKGLSAFGSGGSPETWEIRVRECAIAMDLLVTFLWYSRTAEEVTMIFLNAAAVVEDLKMLLDFALNARQAGNREAGDT